jgi:hypothetical protein
MGLKVRLDEDAKDPNVKDEGAHATTEPNASEEMAAVGSGTAFLLAKRREILGGEDSRARAEEAAKRLAECVGEFARESDVRVSPEGPIVVRAAHLVARTDVEEYRARARSFGASLAGMQTLASGPWPPYSFSKISAV